MLKLTEREKEVIWIMAGLAAMLIIFAILVIGSSEYPERLPIAILLIVALQAIGTVTGLVIGRRLR